MRILIFTIFLFLTCFLALSLDKKKIEPPTNINLTSANNEIILSWKNADKSIKTEIYYSTNPESANKEKGELLLKSSPKETYKFAIPDENMRYYALYSKKGLEYSDKKVLYHRPAVLSNKIIHFYNDPKWQGIKIKIINDKDNAENEFDMIPENNNWFLYKSDQSSREMKFSFYSGNEKIHKNHLFYYKTSANEIWVKNGVLFHFDPGEPKSKDNLTSITVNLHTYQETESHEKLLKVAETINFIDADVVFLQECGQNKDSLLETSPYTIEGSDEIKADNAAYIITKELNEKYGKSYKFLWSWAHYGWNIWEEGVAILTKDAILESEVRYVSSSSSRTVIDSRKVVYLKTKDKYERIFNLFSVHLSYNTEKYKPQKQQIEKFIQFVDEKSTDKSQITLIGGDFNMNPTDDGYFQTISPENKNLFGDSYYLTNPTGYLDNSMIGGKRIDYIFYLLERNIKPMTSQFIFREGEYYPAGRVSDHFGMITNFKIE